MSNFIDMSHASWIDGLARENTNRVNVFSWDSFIRVPEVMFIMDGKIDYERLEDAIVDSCRRNDVSICDIDKYKALTFGAIERFALLID
jgi:hypothetical protein